MRIGLLVRRLNQLPALEGVARAAHARGHEVVLLLYQSGARSGPKAGQWPDPERLPARWATWTTVERFVVGRTEDFDVVLVPGPGSWPAPRPRRHGMATPQWLGVQTAWSDVMVLAPDTLRAWDGLYVWSAAWARWWHGAYAEHDFYETGDLGGHLIPVGHPIAEHLAWIDRPALRRRFGLPADRPVHVYLPFPFRTHGAGWRLEYLYRYAPWGDRAVVARARARAHGAEAVFVVKARRKSALPDWTRRAADLLLVDNDPGEPTALHLFSLATMATGFYSTSVAEAVAAGCQWECLAPAPWPAYRARRDAPR